MGTGMNHLKSDLDKKLFAYCYAPGPHTIICAICKEIGDDCGINAYTCKPCAMTLYIQDLERYIEKLNEHNNNWPEF